MLIVKLIRMTLSITILTATMLTIPPLNIMTHTITIKMWYVILPSVIVLSDAMLSIVIVVRRDSMIIVFMLSMIMLSV